ncbi:MAG TPA: sigma-70 family RNA polymerase sigma factor [Polyangiaceae bacterium]|nr:sigma-70 family RNA polymerase sigma factor [Polyangiaceae bacterium]HMR80552.1 sigma-70 family RNA polymerase sigma factor [Polyangiaceae bacterium]
MAAPKLRASEREDELDPGVLQRCRQGDPLAFRAFVVRFEKPVFALLSRVLGRGPHVEDLAQETFLKAYRALPRFDPEGPAQVSTWLFTIATRTAIDAVRKRRVSERALADSLQQVDVEHADTPERQAELTRVRRAISQALGELPVDQRAAFVLFEIHGLSLPEVAEALDIPAATAKTRVFRARKKLEDALSAFKEGS